MPCGVTEGAGSFVVAVGLAEAVEFFASASDGIGSVAGSAVFAVESATVGVGSAFVAGCATSVGVGFDSPQPTTKHMQARLKAVARFQQIRMARLRVSERRAR